MTRYSEFSKGPIALPERLITHWKESLLEFVKLPRSLKVPAEPMTDTLFWNQLIQSQIENIAELWETFTTEREMVGKYLMDPNREAVAYLAAFHPANEARLLGMLSRMHQRSNIMTRLFKERGRTALYDLGCGTGAISQVLAFLFERHGKGQLSIQLIEARKAFLEAALFGLERIAPETEVRSLRGRLEKNIDILARSFAAPDNDLSIIAMGYFWNEIERIPSLQRKLVQSFAQFISQNRKALILVLEPSNQNIARAAMALRESLVGMGYKALYPCPSSMPCPLLERSRDWCYSEYIFNSPRLLQKIDKLLGIERSRMGSSSYALVSPALYEEITFTVEDPAIIVGRPVVKNPHQKRSYASKRDSNIEFLLCTADGLKKTKPAPGVEESLRGQGYPLSTSQSAPKSGE
jgi:hypothetical protein